MANVRDVVRLINAVAPEANAITDGYDNVGLIVGKADSEVYRVLCCLDVTEEVLREAIDSDVQMIVSHHPMIFYPINKVTDESLLGSKIITAIENGIAIYASHTPLDFTVDGINDYLAGVFKLKDVEVMDKYISENEGLGRVGNLEEEVTVSALKDEVARRLDDEYVRVIGDHYDPVSRVAISNGAGGGETAYVDMALKAGADCLRTADLKPHVAIYAKERGVTVIEPQHYTMEHVYVSRFIELLGDEAEANGVDIELIQSEKDINPRI